MQCETSFFRCLRGTDKQEINCSAGLLKHSKYQGRPTRRLSLLVIDVARHDFPCYQLGIVLQGATNKQIGEASAKRTEILAEQWR